jgi:uncharacterized protein (TIRG00374 family)
MGLTPGGIGITEVTLSGALVVAGMHGRAALGAVLTYRLISFWLVVACGWVVMAALTRRQHRAEADPTASGRPAPATNGLSDESDANH